MYAEYLQRQRDLHRLSALVVLGALLSLLAGGCFFPWLIMWLLTLVHLGFWWQQRPWYPLVQFPSLPGAAAWLCYYLVTYLISILMAQPRTYSHDRTSIRGHAMVIARGWPNEQKDVLLHHCYKTFEKALTRYDPPKVSLHIPPTFYYYRENSPKPLLTLYWYGSSPLLPEHLLTPERIHELLPLLAHHLYFYPYHNQVAPQFEELDAFPSRVPFLPFLALTGNFLWLPARYKRRLIDNETVSQKARSSEEVLQADKFAVALGQGPQLEHLLRLADEQARQRGVRDTNTPPLVERIGHLEVLNAREREELRALGFTPQEPPLMPDKTPKQMR